tara:strand:- start:2472 stop:3050 length:579 start_codon:yes stop_codon:yes gene_type:complete
MKQKMKIGIDLDDVVVGWVPRFIGFYNYKTGSNLKFKDWESYYLGEIVKKNKKEVRKLIDEFVCSNFYDKIELVEGAKEGVEKLSNYHEAKFITARPLRYDERTKELLSKFNLNLPLINCRDDEDNFISKGDICNQLGIGLLIEDCRHYALSCAKKGIQVLLFDRPWNQENSLPENVKRVYSWNEILEKLRN